MAEFCIREAMMFRLDQLERDASLKTTEAREHAAASGMGAGPSLIPAPLLDPAMRHALDFAAGRVT